MSGTVGNNAGRGSGVIATAAGDITKSTSEPAVDTNPSGGVGTIWLRTTTGEMYCCTDATTDANNWTNIGEGSGNVVPTYAVDFLAIGGGAGSAYGGGGAGGYRNSFSTEASGGGASSQDSLVLTPGTQYTITVGVGGAAGADAVNTAAQGVDTTITGSDITTITSHGGGFGGAYSNSTYQQGGDGASGGGGGPGGPGGVSNQTGEGYDGGAGVDGGASSGAGGGGGASEVGENAAILGGGTVAAGDGGDGLASSITGSSVTRAGGGGGGAENAFVGAAGLGGGGIGTTGGGTAGTVNTGGGAGGCTRTGFPGEAGGKGVVILRMATADYSGTTTGSPTEDQATVADTTILIFNADGTYTA